MTISREQLDEGFPLKATGKERAETHESKTKPRAATFAAPFDEPIYTVNEAARVLRLSPNRVRTIFRKEPGVHDLSSDSAKSRFLGRKSQLRIPHGVLMRFWKRTEIIQRETMPALVRRRLTKRTA